MRRRGKEIKGNKKSALGLEGEKTGENKGSGKKLRKVNAGKNVKTKKEKS